MNIADLAKPFLPDAIQWRVGATSRDKSKGLALAYLDARAIMNRLDDVCGVAGWQNKYRDCGGGRLACELLIKIGDEWIGKSDGAGETQVEGEKGAFSSALKRSAVCWGIGRYLYALDSPWVKLKDGKYIEKSEYPRLRSLLEWKDADEKIKAKDDYEKSADNRTEKSRNWGNSVIIWMDDKSVEEVEEWWNKDDTKRSLTACTPYWQGKIKDALTEKLQRHHGEMPLEMEYSLTP